MSSLIQNADKLGILYKALALTTYSSYMPENVFYDNDNPYYHSLNTPSNQWWQVSFSEPVKINKYTIRARSSSSYYQKSWIINASIDNETWKTVDERANQNTLS